MRHRVPHRARLPAVEPNRVLPGTSRPASNSATWWRTCATPSTWRRSWASNPTRPGRRGRRHRRAHGGSGPGGGCAPPARVAAAVDGGPAASGPRWVSPRGGVRSSGSRARATFSSSSVRHSGHSSAVIENIAESRSLPSSPGAQDFDQFRSTPSNRAPVPAMAARQRSLRASVLRSTRDTRHSSKAFRNSRYFVSVFTPAPWADAASQVKPTSIANSRSSPGHRRGSQKAVAPTARPVRSATCAYGNIRPAAARSS